MLAIALRSFGGFVPSAFAIVRHQHLGAFPATGREECRSIILGGQMAAQEIDPKIFRTAGVFDPKASPGGGAYCWRLIEGAALFKIYFCHETRPGMDSEPEAMQFDDCDDEA